MYRTDASDHVVFDQSTQASWKINAPTACLLSAVESGWAPGLPAPTELATLIRDNGISVPELTVALEELEQQGLVVHRDRRPASPAPAARARRYHDLRGPLLRIPATHGRLAELILRASLVLPPLSVCALVVGAWLLRHGLHVSTIAVWTTRLEKTSPWENAILVLSSVALIAATHELGHALVHGAATGQPTWIGVRLFWGIPQAFADVRRISTVPRRRDRTAVLLAGVAAQSFLLFGVMVWALLEPASMPAVAIWMLLAIGPFSAFINLLPLYKSDGYFILQEYAGLTNLGDKGLRAVGALCAADADDAGIIEEQETWWLPWYGLMHVSGVVVGLTVTALLVARALSEPALGLFGLAGAGVYLQRLYARYVVTVSAGGGPDFAPPPASS